MRVRRKNIGFIDMKPLAGGAIEDADLAMRFVCTNPDVTVVIPGMYNLDEITQNLQAVQRTEALTAEENQKIEAVRKTLGSNFCRRCNYCAPCTVGIPIPSVFLFRRISGALWTGRLGEGPVRQPEGEGQCLYRMRRL